MTHDPLEDLRAQLDSLGDRPVSEHPDVLDGVHQVLVAELDALAAKATWGVQPPEA